MYDYHEIKKVHLELTQRCNAGCPMCGRFEKDGSVNHHIRDNLQELTLADCQKIFKPEFIKNLRMISLVGNLGDPIVAHDMLDILKYFRENNKNLISLISTNAGARTTEWWAELASVMGKDGEVRFCIDGLEDTNHLYRRGVDWNTVIRNAQAFIDAGGNAHWHYLIFQHNEHQVEQAEKLAKDMGFNEFVKKKTSRFVILEDQDIKVKPRTKKEVIQAEQAGNKKEITIAVPQKKVYKSAALEKTKRIIEKYGSKEEYLSNTNIVCKVKKEKNVFLCADGLVFPCCWTAHTLVDDHEGLGFQQIKKLVEELGGKDAIDAKKHGLEKVFETGIMRKIEATWKFKNITEGRFAECATRCSEEIDLYAEQYK